MKREFTGEGGAVIAAALAFHPYIIIIIIIICRAGLPWESDADPDADVAAIKFS